MNLKGRNFLTLKDFTPEEITYLIDLAAELKAKKKAGELHEYYKGKNIALIFEKTSTRTRCAFEVAAHDLGMGSTYLDPTGSQIGKKESIADTARVLGRMYEGIEYRGFGQEIVEELAKYAGVPVWNGLTNEYHPTQMLADMLTIREHFGDLKGRRLVYMGDARYNMGNSLMIACSKLGMHFVACTTKKYFPNQELVDLCKTYAEASGGSITLTEDVEAGTKDADVIYTDVWVSTCSKGDQFFLCCFLAAADFLKRFDLYRGQLGLPGKSDHITSALMISISKRNGYHHSYMDLAFQFLRNAVLKTPIQFLMGNIYNDICIHH